jgi:hypothetical protein
VNYWDKVTDRQGEDKKSTITTYITKDWSGKREFVKIIKPLRVRDRKHFISYRGYLVQ